VNVNMSSQMLGVTQSLLAQENEFKDLEKPDGLRFMRMAEFESSGG